MSRPGQGARWRHQEIQKLYERSHNAARGGGISILVSPADVTGRLVIMAPKRLGSAPLRNRCKRRLRAAHAATMPELLADQQYDMIVRVHNPRVATAAFDALCAIFKKAWLACRAQQSVL